MKLFLCIIDLIYNRPWHLSNHAAYLRTLAKWEFFFSYFRAKKSFFHISDNFINPLEMLLGTRHETINKQFAAWTESINSYSHLTVDKFSSQSKLLERDEEKDLDRSYLFCLFYFSTLIILSSQLWNKYLHNGDSLSPSYRHFTRKQIKNAPGKIIEKHNKHFKISSRNSFSLHNPFYKNFHWIFKYVWKLNFSLKLYVIKIAILK